MAPFRACCLIFLVLGCTPSKPKPPDDITTQAHLEQYVESVIETGDPPGISVVVVSNAGPVYRKGFGWADGPREVPAMPDTVYQWW
jgi:CubicO group peptidase (beta-lactamase class C family)